MSTKEIPNLGLLDTSLSPLAFNTWYVKKTPYCGFRDAAACPNPIRQIRQPQDVLDVLPFVTWFRSFDQFQFIAPAVLIEGPCDNRVAVI